MSKLATIAKTLKRNFRKEQVKTRRGSSDFGRDEWKGYDFAISNGGVLRLCQEGCDGKAIEVMTFDDPVHMLCCSKASFSDSVPNAAIVAYCGELY